jgi:hypothetical protein
MANAIKWASAESIVTYLTTELNSLANNARVIGAAIDNSTDKHRFMDVELFVNTQGSARSSGAYVALYLIPSIDDSNYTMGDASTSPPANTLVATMPLDAATNSRYQSALLIPIPPHDFKILIENKTGQSYNAASNTLKYSRYEEEVQ